MFESYGWFFATIAGAFVFGTGGFFMRLAALKAPRSNIITLFGLYIAGTLCFVLLAAIQGTITFAPQVVIGGIIIGLGSVIGNYLWMAAFDKGPTSLSSAVINTNTILVIIMSVVIFGEQLRLQEIAGIILILVSLSFITYDPNETLRVKNNIWYVLMGAAIIMFFMRNGGLKITDEMGFNNTIVLAYGYAVGILWFAVGLRRNPTIWQVGSPRPALKYGMFAGVCSFGGMQLYSYALAHGPASIVAPIFSMNGLVFAALTIILLGERLSHYQAIAMFGCVIGLILIRI